MQSSLKYLAWNTLQTQSAYSSATSTLQAEFAQTDHLRPGVICSDLVN